MEKKYKTFHEFYPYYLAEHTDPTCRTLHFVGSWVVLGILAAAIISGQWIWLLAVPVAGYGFAWVGHFFFEKNRPATFTYPLFSFMGDWVMFFQLLVGKIPFRPSAKCLP